MKKVFFIFILSLFTFSGCDTYGVYAFKIKNSTQEKITLKFVNDVPTWDKHSENKKEVILLPMEEKTVRIIEILNYEAHDCITEHGIAYLVELVFDTYVNGEKLEKQLWQAENWTYQKKSKWLAEFNMTITNEMIDK